MLIWSQQLHHDTGETKEANLETDMKGFAGFHVRAGPPLDRTAFKFMINSFPELASKTTGSFIFALSNIRSVTFPSVMRI